MEKKARNVVVYVRAGDVRSLEEDGEDPAQWIRDLVRKALDRRRERKEAASAG